MKAIFLALLLFCSNAFAAITDLKLSTAQIFDVQWSVSGGSGCDYYNLAPCTSLSASNFVAPYASTGPYAYGNPSLSSGQYYAFFASTTNPGLYGMGVYNSNGTLAYIVHNYGTISKLGPTGLFYQGGNTDPNSAGGYGTVITTSSGYSYGSNATLSLSSGTPTSSELNNYTPPSSTPLAAGQTAQPAAPTTDWKLIRTNSTPVVISNIFPTSNNSPPGEGAAQAFDGNVGTKYLNFDKKNAGVTVRLSQGRVVQKFTLTTANDFSGRDPTSYKLYGSNDGVNWTLIKQDAVTLSEQRFWTSPEIAVANTTAYVYYFILFPTTKSGDGCGLNCDSMQIAEVTYYYDLNDGVTSTDTGSGGTPSNPGQAGSVCADCAPTWPSTSDISIAQTAQRNSAKSRVSNIELGNSINLEQKIGSSGNSVTIEQTGNYNKIAGIGGGTYAVIDGDNNTVNIKQGDTLGKNLIEFNVIGNTNNISIWQARNPSTGLQDGGESGGHYIGLNVNGSTNTLTLKQSNTGGATSGHFAYVDVTGNNNQGALTQSNNSEKTFFGIVNGSNNVFNVTQQGSVSYFDLSLTGNGHSVTANQKDAGSHKATVNLTNAGGASTVNLVQQGATAQNINITQQCATLSGCSVSVTQGGGP
jgi:hypothetical protein